jgi:hypothetical protein
MSSNATDLATCLVQPDRLAGLGLGAWDQLIPEARTAGLLGRLCILAEERGVLRGLPQRVSDHLQADRLMADKHGRDVAWEVRQIRNALKDVVPTFILLKGAAYVMAGLPPARGRLFADVDVLVPHDALGAVEAALMRHGWSFGEIDPYDDMYYRRFTHQIPPLVHGTRRTAIDVHHTIVQVTARVRLSPQQLWADARPIGEGVCVLSPADMVLHSAVHLFNDGEFHRALRDLDDITSLLRHFAAEPGFAARLVERAVALDLVRPLYYALRYSRELLDGPLPETLLADAPGVPSPALLTVMDALFRRVLRSPHPERQPAGAGLAGFLLYVRAHQLRMPMHMLIPHLIRKSYRRDST